jgi:hypothetical protein
VLERTQIAHVSYYITKTPPHYLKLTIGEIFPSYRSVFQLLPFKYVTAD